MGRSRNSETVARTMHQEIVKESPPMNSLGWGQYTIPGVLRAQFSNDRLPNFSGRVVY